jgi:hypothetical protein
MVLHTTYVLRVPYSCGVVLVFLVVAGNSFCVTYSTYLVYNTIQFCGGKANFVRIFLLNPNFLLVHRSFSKILRFSTALYSQPFRKNIKNFQFK